MFCTETFNWVKYVEVALLLIEDIFLYSASSDDGSADETFLCKHLHQFLWSQFFLQVFLVSQHCKLICHTVFKVLFLRHKTMLRIGKKAFQCVTFPSSPWHCNTLSNKLEDMKRKMHFTQNTEIWIFIRSVWTLFWQVWPSFILYCNGLPHAIRLSVTFGTKSTTRVM